LEIDLKADLLKVTNSKKLENAIFISVILFIYKIIFPINTTFLYLIINELLIFISVFAWVRYVSEFINPRLSKPLSLVINTGILNALVFFIISISSWLFNETQNSITSSNIIYVLFSTIIVFVFIGSLAYIFSVYKNLCFHRQKKDPSLYFNTMVVFFILTSLASSFLSPLQVVEDFQVNLDSGNDFVYNSFYVITIGLILINSLRVAWIAFLNKKQKLALLAISIVLSVLSWINFSTLMSDEFVLIRNFSPAMETLLSLVMVYGAIYFTIIFFTTLFHLPTAEAIDRKSEELTSVKDLGKLMNQVFDFEELSETITNTTIKVSNSDAAWIAINEDKKTNLQSIIGLGIIDANILTEFLIKNKILSDSEVKVIDLEIFDKKHKLPKSVKSLVSAPLTVHNCNRGFLFAARKTSRIYEEEDSKPVGTFAGFAAVALENAKLLEESLEKERLEKELDVARAVQYKILPQKNPRYDKFEITSLFVPAFEVGGDYYDFFRIDESRLGIVIADVSGKGIEAAFIMAEVKGIFSTLARLYENPKDLLIMANSILEDSITRKSFVTAIYGIIEFKNETFNFARAGHSPLLYYHNENVERYVPTGIGLGLDYSSRFEESIKEMEIKLNNNDIITLFTDGINESVNENMEEFGYERLEEIIKNNANLTVDEISNEIMKSITTFSKNSYQHDDITLVLIKWKSHKN
jgi:sigma-B regulation protein RsbU (phosphoserine phosphatase)